MNKKICLIHIMSRLGQDLFLKEVKFSTLKNTLNRSYRRKKDYYFVFWLLSSTKYQKSLRNRSSPLFRLFRLYLKLITVQASSCHEELTTAPFPRLIWETSFIIYLDILNAFVEVCIKKICGCPFVI